jgi:hypothetical protein
MKHHDLCPYYVVISNFHIGAEENDYKESSCFSTRIQILHTIVIGNIQINPSFVLFLQALQIFGANVSFL